MISSRILWSSFLVPSADAIIMLVMLNSISLNLSSRAAASAFHSASNVICQLVIETFAATLATPAGSQSTLIIHEEKTDSKPLIAFCNLSMESLQIFGDSASVDVDLDCM